MIVMDRFVRQCWALLCEHDFHFRRPDGSWGALKCWYCGRDYLYPRDSRGFERLCTHDRQVLAVGGPELEVLVREERKLRRLAS